MKGYRHYEAWPQPGDISGRLSAVKALPHTKGRRRWLWMCECGNLREAYVSHVRNRLTQSCGCILKELLITHGATVGYQKAAEYSIWTAMIARCENANGPSFYLYGGRGITVCERWRTSYPAFLADVGPRPSATHSIERIDSNGNYEPANVKWATPAEQSRNTRRNLFVDVLGKRVCLKDAAKNFGVSYSRTLARYHRGKRGVELFHG